MYRYRLIDNGDQSSYSILKDGFGIFETDKASGNILVTKLRNAVNELEQQPIFSDIRQSIRPIDSTEENLIEKPNKKTFTLEVVKPENVNVRVREDMPTISVFIGENTDI